ncbi:MAG TPA: hypothetical protein DD723_05780 [Candidatus Omnitrophica bacterium]|nr:MAG: hypothetical protein A2Z81_02660 [Omnitrophica WOR_2 bacterium GWA2_45_18]OGX19511.1 MAG: hypothetical protein A2Y04_05830 [Omnitrophica WOR_2 bacterium GWC2_45_7]HBR15036.1 hypothetical protein [Candidatus Omnitrophota bacterium]
MFEDFPQFLPSGICLSCDGCCRFKDRTSPWRPRVTNEERQEILSITEDRTEENFTETSIQGLFYIKAVRGQGQAPCVFLKLDENICRVYARRPLECRLYPFLLTKKGDEMVVCVHLSCPFVQEQRTTAGFERYVQDLERYFQKKRIRDFLKENPSLAWDYSAYEIEMEELFVIKL